MFLPVSWSVYVLFLCLELILLSLKPVYLWGLLFDVSFSRKP